MLIYYKTVLIFNIFKLCFGALHSYHFDHRSREDLAITRIASIDHFQIEYNATNWKTIQSNHKSYAAGLMNDTIAIVTFSLNDTQELAQKSFIIDGLETAATDLVLLKTWNTATKDAEIVIVVATQKPEVLWFRLEEARAIQFWAWPTAKNITHLNLFQMQSNNHLLVLTQYFGQASADLYEFQLEPRPNFWLRQSIPLVTTAGSAAISKHGPHYYLSIPQPSTLITYHFSNNHFVHYQNLTSAEIDHVTSFQIGHKTFLAFNGLDAGIYQFSRNGLERERVAESNLEGVHYWLPISAHSNRDDTILIAQRSLIHQPHETNIIEIITYDGMKFEEHEDVPCSYYGEELLGSSCLPGEGENHGVEGSAPIFIDGFLALLVPRQKGCDLFRIETKVTKRVNPLERQVEDFQRMRHYLDNILAEQQGKLQKNDKIVSSSQKLDPEVLKQRMEVLTRDLTLMTEKFKAIKEHENKTQYERVIFNGVVKIENPGVFKDVDVGNLGVGHAADALLEDIVMKNQLGVIAGRKTFTSLKVSDLDFQTVNQINSTDLLYATDADITIKGDLGAHHVTVGTAETQTMNGRVFEDEVVRVNRAFGGDLVFDQMEVDDVIVEKLNNLPVGKRSVGGDLNDWEDAHFETLLIHNNIQALNVNGESFEKFLSEICMKNIRTFIPGHTKINGDIDVIDRARINLLNGLRFPEEYVFSDHTSPNISGKKHFTDLTTSEVHCESTIDGIQPSTIITLSEEQTIPGKTTLNKPIITESLWVRDGHVIGEHASKYLPNPTLQEVNTITSNVHFKNLEVNGSIILSDHLNERDFHSILSDFIYMDEENVTIEAMKEFPEDFTVRSNLEIQSDTINDVPLSTIVTKDTEQFLNFSTINGIVNFGNLEIDGLYNSINVAALDAETVKITGEQYISATLIFEDDLEVPELEIVETINGLSREEIATTSHQNQAKIEDLEEIDVDNVIVVGDFIGTITDFDVEGFNLRRMSFTQDQVVEANYEITKSTIGELKPRELNDVEMVLLGEDTMKKMLRNRLAEGKININELHVEGALDVDQINNQNAFGMDNALWKGAFKNKNMTTLKFRDDVNFASLNIEILSSVSFKRFIENIVFKNESNVKIAGVKTFHQGLTVAKLIETEQINGIPINQILTKHGDQTVSSPIIISGNLTFDVDVDAATINQIPINLLVDGFEETDNGYKVTGDVVFNRLIHVRSMEINGSCDNRPVEQFLQSLIFKDDDFKLSGTVTFENQVDIKGNVRVVDKINDVNLPVFLSKMVMLSKDTDISSPVRFTQTVTIEDKLTLDKLTAEEISGLKPQKWLEEVIFINKGLLPGSFILEDVEINELLHTDFINDVNMSSLIPLRTKQNLPPLDFEEITSFADITVANLTNSLKLPQELENSVMTNSMQEISSEVEFLGNVFITGDVSLSGKLNDLDVTKIVTTNSEQELSAIYNFRAKTILEGNFSVSGTINRINFISWLKEGVKTKANEEQVVDANWVFDNDLVFMDDVSGDGRINGLDIKQFMEEVEAKRKYKYTVEKDAIDDYYNICQDLTYIHTNLKKQIYKFNYLENLQTLHFESNVKNVHHFKHNNHTFILLSEANQCHSHLLISKNYHFQYLRNVTLGSISQIITVQDSASIFFVTLNTGCAIQGTNLWEFTANYNFHHLATIENQELLQDSLIPLTFYGISNGIVTEFKIAPRSEVVVRKFRKWEIHNQGNMAFVPRGLSTGLAITTGTKLIRLDRSDPFIDDEDSSYETEVIIRGNFTEEYNPHFPIRKSDLVVMNVGMKSDKKSLLAVASHEETSVKGNLDFIKIYEDAASGKLFHKVLTQKPSSLITLDFNNGETLLAFMENNSILQIYEYKGIEGFKHKMSAKLEGSELFTLSIPTTKGKEAKIIGLINRNSVSFIEAVMLGNQIEKNLQCL